MSCSNCTKGFSLFNREHGCPGCGFSVCSGCLKKSLMVKNKIQKVCNKCFSKSENPQQNILQPEPPDALRKRMEKDPLPRVLSPQSKPSSKLSSEDERLAARLKALQSERSDNVPSTDQVRDRLEKLKGERSTTVRPDRDTRPVYQAPDTRTNVERSSDLLGAVTAEVDLESRMPILTPEQDIEQRLARLRGETGVVITGRPTETLPDPSQYLTKPGGSEGYVDIDNLDMDEVNKLIKQADEKAKVEADAALKDLEKDKVIQEQLAKLKIKKDAGRERNDNSDDEDDETTDTVISRIMAEVRLEDRLSPLEPGVVSDRSGEPEELPWCVICNDDAKVRCRDCDGDLYCHNCFREFHTDSEERNHRVDTFKK